MLSLSCIRCYLLSWELACQLAFRVLDGPQMTYGCLVIHGLTGTPATVASITHPLISSGFRVVAPCLAGHGGTLEELAQSTWQEWYDTVRIAYHSLRQETDRIFFVGLSLGTLLGLKLAMDEGWGIRALALIGTPLHLGLKSRLAIRLVRYSPLRWVVKSVPKNLEDSVLDPEGRVLYRQLALTSIPCRAAFELADFIRVVRSELRRVSNPLLLIHGRHDRVAPPSNVNLVCNQAASDVVETAILERSSHVVTMDFEKELAARRKIDFFRRFF